MEGVEQGAAKEGCVDEDNGFLYEEISVEDDGTSSGDENLNTAIQKESHHLEASKYSRHRAATPTSTQCEVVEDFVCNFLATNVMIETLETFQAEWYRHHKTDKVDGLGTCDLPDVYAQNRTLEALVHQLRAELKEHKEVTRQAKEMLVRVQKERDYHRMHHRRVLQEKDSILTDLKTIRSQYDSTEPIIGKLKQSYEKMMRQKALVGLERDRYKSQTDLLLSTMEAVQQDQPISKPPTCTSDPTLLEPDRMKSKYLLELPSEPDRNPYHHLDQLPVCTHFSRIGGFQPSQSFKAHSYAVTDVDIHPNRPHLATASDDHHWKLWSLTSGERLLTGEGHNDWLSAVEFNPNGTCIASSSGDGFVKVWELVKGDCTSNLKEHQQPVWDVAWHWSGSLLASASMDQTLKLWQPEERSSSVMTLRGHSDSVNGVCFMPYSNSFVSCSADKSISQWDIRAGLCVHTFYGHRHAIYALQTSYQGWELFSGDCFGNVLCWDVRARGCVQVWRVGPEAINKIAVDPARSLLACSSDQHVLVLLDLTSSQAPPTYQQQPAPREEPKEWRLQHHQDRVLGVAFTKEANGLVSADCEGVVTIWQ